MTALTLHGRSFVFRETAAPGGAFSLPRPSLGDLERIRLEAVLQQARQAGIVGKILDVLGDPRLVPLVARRFQVPQPSLDACRRYYREHEEEFRQPDRYVGRQIVLPYPAGDPELRAEAMARAERMIAILFFDPRMFDDLLASYDCLHERAGSGRIGPVGPGELPPEMESALFALRPGQICPTPVVTGAGIHILLLDRIFPGEVPAFDAVHDRISRHLCRQFKHAAAARHLGRLAARYRAGRAD